MGVRVICEKAKGGFPTAGVYYKWGHRCPAGIQFEKNKKIIGSFRSSRCGADAAVTDHGCSGSECEI